MLRGQLRCTLMIVFVFSLNLLHWPQGGVGLKEDFFNLTRITNSTKFRCNPQFQLFLNVDTNKRTKGIFGNFIENSKVK